MRCKSMQALERHRGHFYNWYDTQSLSPLAPRYISTVDSGNLAGHLLTLRAALVEIADAPIVGLSTVSRLGRHLADCGADRGRFHASERRVDTIRERAQIRVAARSRSRLPARMRIWRSWPLTHTRRSTRQQAGLPLSSEALEWVRGAGRAMRGCARRIAPSCSVGDVARRLAGHARSDACRGSFRRCARSPASTRNCRRSPPFVATSLRRRPIVSRASRCARSSPRAASTRATGWRRLSIWQAQVSELAQMEYDFLFDHARRQLAIGYNVGDRRLDASYYDLLASEARLANFVAIAQGKLPQESWFALGRTLTTSGGAPVLLSWSGSMFEYLMPLAGHADFRKHACSTRRARPRLTGKSRTAASAACRGAFRNADTTPSMSTSTTSIAHSASRDWDSSADSADDLVIAPYASALALMVAPEAACVNLQQLAAEGIWRAGMDSTKRSTTRRRDCGAAKRAPWSARSWPITRG